jgi:PPOX class probable F420-dependent enzyme
MTHLYARAVSFVVRAGKVLDKYVWDRIRDRRASEVTSGVPGGFEALKGRKYALVVTFKRNGQPVPTPTWFGLGEDGNVYTRTFADSWKVKRIGRDPRVLVAPSDPRGKPLGPTIEGSARVLPNGEWGRAERAIAANYGLGRKLYMAPTRGRTDASTYLEITPVSA